MKLLLVGILILAAFSACKGGTPGNIPPFSALQVQTSQSRLGNQELLYITTNQNIFYVVKYATGHIAETLKLPGLTYGEGACSEGSGNVFLAAFEDSPSQGGQIFEYEPGGKTPVAVLADGANYVPYGCSIDPTTGNLAAPNNSDQGGGHPQAENIAIYPDAQSPPTTYTDSNFQHYDSVAYDNNGNLFIFGNGAAPSYKLELAELAEGSSSLTAITLPEQVTGNHIQWDGQYLAICEPSVDHRSPIIYRLQITGSTATLAGTVTFRGNFASRYSGQVFYISGGSVTLGYRFASVGVWKYPEGGRPQRIIKKVHWFKTGLTLVGG